MLYHGFRVVEVTRRARAHGQVVVGGGQSADKVTTTAGRAGKFQAVFFHKIYETEVGSVRGHFGPINSLMFNPDGRSFTSGGEDGYVRIHHFDPEYFGYE